MCDGVLLVAGVLNVGSEERGVEEIDDAEAVTVDLVLVSRADAATGGADGLASGCGLGCELDHAVVGQDDLGAVGDEQLAIRATGDGQACLAQFFDFAKEGCGVEDDTIADDSSAAGAQDAAGDELQHVFFAVNDDGVTGVVASSIAGDHIELLGEDVDDLTLAFVAPLGS